MKIAILTSGGVDSSVALMLLKEQGYDVTAFYLKIWLEDELQYLGNCPWEEDLEYVRSICERGGIPLKIVSLQREYFDIVVKYALDEIRRGRTPNPDIMCNNHIKFGLFLDKIGSEFAKVASGHYAQVEERKGSYFLRQSPDPIKDQTYFLARLSQKQLARAMFPIGHFTKKEVRALAEKYDLPNKNRKDSQGICFLGKVPYGEFIRHYLGERRGDIVEYETGVKLGEHEGCWYFTPGQRKGIGLSGGPWFVVRKNSAQNEVYVSRAYHAPEKKRDIVEVRDCYWFAGKPPKGFRHSGKRDFCKALKVKLRHGPGSYKVLSFQTGRSEENVIPDGRKTENEHYHSVIPDGRKTKSEHYISVIPDGKPNVLQPLSFLTGSRRRSRSGIYPQCATRATITLDSSDQGIAPGQFAVFYEDDLCIGSGIMTV